MNQAAQRLAKICPQPASRSRRAGNPPEQPAEVTSFDSLEAFAAACRARERDRPHGSVWRRRTNEISLSTDQGNFSLTLAGGDLLTPGITRSEGLQAAHGRLLDLRRHPRRFTAA